MCQKCLDAVQQYFPAISKDQAFSFLVGATCFPFGDSDQVAAQLKGYADLGLTAGQALAKADEDTEAAMRSMARPAL